MGINIELRTLSWNAYLAALQDGDFDMYYAEVMLPPDCDPAALLSPSGSLNYGGVQDDTYAELFAAYLGAEEEVRPEAAKALCDYVYQRSHIIPIVYKKLAVYTHRNVFEGMSPSQSGILCGIASYAVSFDFIQEE